MIIGNKIIDVGDKMKRWTKEEVELLIDLKENKKLKYKDIANILNKTPQQCASKYQRHHKYDYTLNGSFRTNRKWTNEEDNLLKKHKDNTYKELMELFPDRTINSITNRMQKLGVKRIANITINYEQEQFIKENYLKMTNVQLARALNVDRQVIARVKRREGLETEKVWKLNKIEFDEEDIMSINAEFELSIEKKEGN
ncbi:hypothetical protein QTV22_001782 [Staphylococcus pseudintermedius]|nr:hypothetical protein [Staphylococcus pseudintermedius]ELP8755697.1 hypothetical protein [Staphylococcus pseudintermedius]HCA7521790.1 hypothetical protein [Staphylococcus pseudintermedius]